MQRQIFEHHPVLGYRFIPGLKVRVPHEAGGYLVQVNQTGFRCQHEFTRSQPEGARRALLFGDSFTAGDGVSNRQRFGDRLEALIPRLQVFNFGLPGTGTDQQLLAFKEFGSELECDLVIIAVMVENIRRNSVRYRPFADEGGKLAYYAKPYFELDAEGGLELGGVPVPKAPLSASEAEAMTQFSDRGGRHPLLRGVVNRLGPRVKQTVQRLTGYQPVPGYDSRDSSEWRLMRAILEHWFAQVRAEVIVFPIPLYQHVEGTASARGYQARFAELARPSVTICDPLPSLQRLSDSEKRALRFQTDVHPTPFAHEQLAIALSKAVEQVLGSERPGGSA